jgi:hypothetical protein
MSLHPALRLCHQAKRARPCALCTDSAVTQKGACLTRTQLDMFIFAVAAFHIDLSTLTILLAYL